MQPELPGLGELSETGSEGNQVLARDVGSLEQVKNDRITDSFY